MKCSEGGFDWPTIVDLDFEEFDEMIEASAEAESRITKAAKG